MARFKFATELNDQNNNQNSNTGFNNAPTFKFATDLNPGYTPPPATSSQPFDWKSQFISSHAPYQAPRPEPNILQKIGKSMTESIPGGIGYRLGSALKNGDFQKPAPYLPNYTPTTRGDKAINFIGKNVFDLPVWVAGDMALVKPLAALSKFAPIAKATSLLPKAITPALGTGVRAATTFGGPINAVETAMNGDGVQGFTNRLKEAPLMGLGGAALHGAGQAIGKGIKTGIDFNRFNKVTKLPEINPSSLEDVQAAFRNPNTLRDAQSQQLSKTFNDPLNNMGRTGPTLPRQGLNPSELLQSKQQNAQSAFGKPIASHKFNTDIKDTKFEISAKMDNQVQTIMSHLKQVEKQTKDDTLSILKQVKSLGGISRSKTGDLKGEWKQSIPKMVKNKNGLPLDQMADELEMNSRELLDSMAKYNKKGITDFETEAYRVAFKDPEYQSLSNTLDTLNRLSPSTRKVDGLIPLKPREIKQPSLEQPIPQRTLPGKPAHLIWTNKDRLQNSPLPIRSITEDNLGQLPGQRLASPRITANETIVAPIGEGSAPITQVPIRSVAANIENPSSSRITIDPEASGVAPIGNGRASSAITSNTMASLPEPLLPGTADSFRAKVDRNPAKGTTISEKLRGIRTQFVDDVAPLENVEKSINGKVASAEDSLYKQARLFRGSPERADELVKSTLTPIIKKVEKSGQSTKDLGDYALAVHARDVNSKGIESGFTNEEIAATIQKFGTPEMEASRQELIKISNDSLDSLAEAGLIDEGLVTALREKHPNYMPLFRSFDDDKIEFASGVSKAMANVTAPINRLVGSSRNVIDPIESMIKNIYKTVSAVDRNKVAAQLGKLADNDTSSTFVRRLAEGEEKSRLNTVYAMEGGQKVHYEVQPDVYKSLLNLDKESSNLLIKILQKPAGLLRSGATLTPEFSLRNPIRDVVNAFTVSKSGLNPVTDVPKALFDVIRSKMGKDTMYNQFLKDNAGFGNIISMDRKAHQEVMNDILSQPVSKKFVNIVSGKSLLNVLRTITDVTESATKLGEYRAALRSGVSRPEAAYRARDLMDFARAGASIRETNKIVAFLNANIQGKSKLYRAIKENPVGVTTRAFSSITVPTIGVYMAQKYLSNDEQKAIINDAPDWMTSTFWLVPIPGTSQVARIPKPFDLAPIFANLPERAMKYIEGNDPAAFDGFAKQTLASAALPTMITGLIPLIEGMSNYSMFRQGPIIPQREADLNFPDQYDIRTTGTAKFIAKGVNKVTGGTGPLKNFGSPRIIDNTIQGLTAGLGNYATSAIDFITESTGLAENKQKPARNLSEMPLLRAFLTSEKSGGKAMSNLYDEKDKLTRDKGSALITSPKLKFPLEKRLKSLSTATGSIGDITKEIRKIENSKDIAPQVKRDKINLLVTKRNSIASKTMGK